MYGIFYILIIIKEINMAKPTYKSFEIFNIFDSETHE